ncbi:RHS repeat protein [Xanthomonas protegens]|uniref:RHS repeat protein n=1 Tax=Xanthomonas protegens TaxID=3380705 RepID=A0ABU9LBW2_9XANT
MFIHRQGGRNIALLFCLFLLGTKEALSAVTPEDEFVTRIRSSQDLKPIGNSPFGENVDLYTGQISFRQTDIDQPGIGLPIQLIRELSANDLVDDRAFGDWWLEVPSIRTITVPENDFFSNKRCSNFSRAPDVSFVVREHHSSVYLTADQWWGGYQLEIPGSGRQDLLKRDPNNTNVPQMIGADGSKLEFPIVTKKNWVVACLPNIANDSGGNSFSDKTGEGFLVVSPEGTKYWMNWLIYREYADATRGPRTSDAGRQMAIMMATRVEDRYGNSLSYEYDPSGNLTKIQSSDGRTLTLAYESWDGWQRNLTSKSKNSRVISATIQASDAPSRTWRYAYSTDSENPGSLISVTLPDQTFWSISAPNSAYNPFITHGLGSKWGSYSAYSLDDCASSFSKSSDTFEVVIRHPTGLVGTFTIGSLVRGRSYVPFDCGKQYQDSKFNYVKIRNLYNVLDLVAKKMSGPGVNEQQWIYRYSDPGNSWSKDCSAGCTDTVWTDVKQPNGSITRYTFSNRYDSTESLLLKYETYSGDVGSALARSEKYAYARPNSGPWPNVAGDAFLENINKEQVTSISPRLEREIFQDGDLYYYSVEKFDNLARPISFTRTSPWTSRSDNIDYMDSRSKWVLGQLEKEVNINTGIIESEFEYDAETANLIKKYSYGKLQKSFSYNPDGTMATVSDANGNVTRFANWKRGTPQAVTFADNSSVALKVNDDGWITARSDENGYITSYSYDIMGRMAGTSYPTNDNVTWSATSRLIEQVNASEYGLAAGHWRQTITTGNARREIYLDAFWRPVLTREYDATDIASTQRFQRFAYDSDGRQIFASYVGASDNLTTGKWTSYDVLGRPVSVSQNSEQGLLTTLTEYLQGNKTRVTDPRGNQTVTGYQVFDQPDYTKPVWIQHPEGAYTDINRDIFGKPLSIRRHDANGAVAVTRSYVYDTYRQLCKTVEPETGATANGYDAAGNLVWSAAGLALPSTTSCDADSAFASGRRVDRSYDVRNRIRALSFPDGNGNQAWSYWPDGAVKQITTTNNGVATYNSYAYNKRRLLIAESQGQADGETWALGYAYDANGNLAAHRYPSGQMVDYAPNALGQPTQAGSYVTGVSYYPNGAIKQFTYGNGIVHTMTQNARQLPDTSRDAYGDIALLSDGYDYDANGNVAGISDGATGRGGRGNRDMTYDGLDRLTSTKSAMFGSTPASYSYDVLDNLIHVVAPGRDHYYCYDANWQLTNVKTGSCGGSTVIGMSYDSQGNLSNKNGQAFVFDYGNRLRQATGKETYRYDGNGRRTLALQSAGNIGSLYDQSGALRFQKNQRKSKSTDYILLGGSLVAEADWPLGQLASVKDYVNWNPVSGATRYVVEESVDGVTWTSVYDGSQGNWTSLARPAGTYSYRVTACTADGNCTAASNVTHDQRPAVDIVPLLYQLLLNG